MNAIKDNATYLLVIVGSLFRGYCRSLDFDCSQEQQFEAAVSERITISNIRV